MKNRVKEILFLLFARLTKGWYLCCHKHGRKNLNAYPNIYFREKYLFLENSTIWFNYKPNEQTEHFV